MAQGNRLDRVSQLVQNTLADILLRETEDSRFHMVTILSVSLAKDLSTARVYVSVLDETNAKEIVAALNNASKFFRHALAKSKIEIRVIPDLKFVYDDSTARGSHINSLIHEAIKNIKND